MSAINPYEEVRHEIGGKLVYIKTSLEAVIDRDVKGLYAKALSGEIPNFTGISDPFEEPSTPDLVIETDKNTVQECMTQLCDFVLDNT